MKKALLLALVLLIAFSGVAHAGSKPKNPRHKGGGDDPCVAQGNCGNGDHGNGNPVNGSLHANPNAWQGEVDPVSPTPEDVPDEPPEEEPVILITCQVVITGTGAVEVALGLPFSEDNLVIEAPEEVYLQAIPGEAYSVLEWTSYFGHSGRVRSLVVDKDCVEYWAIEQDWPMLGEEME